jgi:hypothetical protein
MISGRVLPLVETDTFASVVVEMTFAHKMMLCKSSPREICD